jgi:N6-adenosine-specific RNA methylase IME4
VMHAWGFTLKTEIVWLKRTSHDKRWFGMRRIVRAEHETCLVGTRGRPVTKTRSMRSTFKAVVCRRHSEKPAVFYDLIETLCKGPYVETLCAALPTRMDQHRERASRLRPKQEYQR